MCVGSHCDGRPLEALVIYNPAAVTCAAPTLPTQWQEAVIDFDPSKMAIIRYPTSAAAPVYGNVNVVLRANTCPNCGHAYMRIST